MKRVADNLRKGKPYPYEIPQVHYPAASQTEAVCDPWDILEFFRIEALLRSKSLFYLYEKREQHDGKAEMLKKYRLRWEILKGSHHSLLIGEREGRVKIKHGWKEPSYYVGRGIIDLSGMAEAEYHEAFYRANLTLRRDEDGPRAILFAIDPARPPEATIKDLRPYLQKLNKPYKGKMRLDDHFVNRKINGSKKSASRKTSHKTIPPDQFIIRLNEPLTETISIPLDRCFIGVNKEGESPSFDTYKSPSIKGHDGIETWLRYFRCYDLRIIKTLTFGEIARQVYGQRTQQTYERAEQACKRVRRLIEAAEQNNWPPSIR